MQELKKITNKVEVFFTLKNLWTLSYTAMEHSWKHEVKKWTFTQVVHSVPHNIKHVYCDSKKAVTIHTIFVQVITQM